MEPETSKNATLSFNDLNFSNSNLNLNQNFNPYPNLNPSPDPKANYKTQN